MHINNQLKPNSYCPNETFIHLMVTSPVFNDTLTSHNDGNVFIQDVLRNLLHSMSYEYIRVILEKDHPDEKDYSYSFNILRDTMHAETECLYDEYMTEIEEDPDNNGYFSRIYAFFGQDMNQMYTALVEIVCELHRVCYYPWLNLLQQFAQTGYLLSFHDVTQYDHGLELLFIISEVEYVLQDYFLDYQDEPRVMRLQPTNPLPLNQIGSPHQQHNYQHLSHTR